MKTEPLRSRLGLVAAAASLLFLAACAPAQPPAVAETVRPAFVSEVRAGAADRLAFVGEVRATRRAELAFAVSGRVAVVNAELGDAVRAGQLLAQLDEQPLKAQVAAVAGDVARAQAQLAEARQRAERLRSAREAGAASPAEAGAVQAELASADAALRSAVAQQELAAWSLASASLRAPVDGVIGARTLERGQATGPGAPVFALDGAGRELAILVPGSLALKPGQAATLRSGSTELASRVLRTGGRLEVGGVHRVFLAVPDSAAVGSTWSATLSLESGSAALQVPLRAVLPAPEAGQAHVLRIAKDGRSTEKVAVRTGTLHGDWIDVLEGLSAGDRVVIAGAAAIRPGAAVKPVAYRAEVRS